ncbi:MAG: hypothetical protein EOM67_07205 [Spirochaetia bacterium]|nr:hypothetical protein [Spirochaetia bacterium]
MNKYKRRIFSVALLLVVLISFSYATSVSPTERVSLFLTALQQGNIEKAVGMSSGGAIDQRLLSAETEEEKMALDLFGKVFKRISFTAPKIKSEGNLHAEVDIVVSSIDGEALGTAVITKLFPYILNPEFNNDEEKMEQLVLSILLSELDSPSLKMKNEEITIPLIKENDEWMVVFDGDLLDSFSGDVIKD